MSTVFRLGINWVLNNGPEGDQQYYCEFRGKYSELLNWLIVNVGPFKVKPIEAVNSAPETSVRFGRLLKLPIEGDGWRIAEGHKFANPVEKYAKKVGDTGEDDFSLEKAGPFGDWLVIEKLEYAILFNSTGLFDKE